MKCINHPKREAPYADLGLCRSCYQGLRNRGELPPKRERKFSTSVTVAMTDEMAERLRIVSDGKAAEWIRSAIEEKLSDLDSNQGPTT
jgi:hypothetical protein